MKSLMNANPRIAIVGGGPAGLTLARLLHLQGITATIFERDTHSLERPQGGTLDLHEESGLLALQRAGLTDAFQAVARYEDQGTRLLDKHGQVLFEDPDTASGNRPEVDRTALRAMLLDALPDGMVQWNRPLREVLDNGDGRWNLLFDAGIEGPFDLVIGADGTWSRVRPLLSPYMPQYSGLCFVEFGIDETQTAVLRRVQRDVAAENCLQRCAKRANDGSGPNDDPTSDAEGPLDPVPRKLKRCGNPMPFYHRPLPIRLRISHYPYR